MTTKEFEKLLLQSESTIIDFKSKQYDFADDNDLRKTSEFVKDIISFSNTIRTDSAYIVIGIGITEYGEKQLIGLDKNIDDSILQEKIKNKVYPIPKFSYSTLKYKDKIYGIIEIPIFKYETPISSTLRLKGLEPGKFYFRRGSTNSEATGHESINIAKWFDSLPSLSLLNEAYTLINKLTTQQYSLSSVISEMLILGRKYNLSYIKTLCLNELSGYINKSNETESYQYRINNVLVTHLDFKVQPFSTLDTRQVMNQLRDHKDVFEAKMFFQQSIIEIEDMINKSSQRNTILTINSTGEKFVNDPEYKNLKVTIFLDGDNINNIYKNIRQKMIDALLQLVYHNQS